MRGIAEQGRDGVDVEIFMRLRRLSAVIAAVFFKRAGNAKTYRRIRRQHKLYDVSAKVGDGSRGDKQ